MSESCFSPLSGKEKVIIIAFITFAVPYKNHLAMVVPAAKARKIQDTLDNPPDEISAEQEEFLMCIKHIYHGKRSQNKDPDTSHLTNKGIAQSMYDALPTGDR